MIASKTDELVLQTTSTVDGIPLVHSWFPDEEPGELELAGAHRARGHAGCLDLR
jgi:hypothetical protein